MARRVAHIQVHTYDGKTRLCAYWYSAGRGNVTDRYMSFCVKCAATKLVYPRKNIRLDRNYTHSNRAGGACAMKQAIFDDESIRKMNAFLEYIQQQLSGFSQGMATKMIRIARFSNMEGPANHTG